MCGVLICPVQAHYFLFREEQVDRGLMSPILLQTQSDTRKKMSIYWQKKVSLYFLTSILAFLRQIRPFNHEMSSGRKNIGQNDGGFVSWVVWIHSDN